MNTQTTRDETEGVLIAANDAVNEALKVREAAIRHLMQVVKIEGAWDLHAEARQAMNATKAPLRAASEAYRAASVAWAMCHYPGDEVPA